MSGLPKKPNELDTISALSGNTYLIVTNVTTANGETTVEVGKVKLSDLVTWINSQS